MRHFSRLASLNFSIAKNSIRSARCTMKYNPVVNEVAAVAARLRRPPSLPAGRHRPGRAGADVATSSRPSARSSGMDRISLQPAAGAHGEWTGLP